MREADLPSPNIGGTGFHLRRVAVKAISQIQAAARNMPGGVHPRAGQLRAFFSFCADALAPFDPTPLDENDG